MKDKLIQAIQAAICIGIGAILMWAHLSNLASACEAEQRLISIDQRTLDAKDNIIARQQSIIQILQKREAQAQVKVLQASLPVERVEPEVITVAENAKAPEMVQPISQQLMRAFNSASMQAIRWMGLVRP